MYGRRDGGLWTHAQVLTVLIATFFACNLLGGLIILFIGVLVFSVVVVIITALIVKRRDKMEGSEIATYVVIIAWGSFFWGLLLSKYAK